MTRYIVALCCLTLVASCASVPTEAVSAVSQAGGGCVKSSGLWGTLIVIVGSADKGVIRNGEVNVAGDCGGVTIRETKPVAPAR